MSFHAQTHLLLAASDCGMMVCVGSGGRWLLDQALPVWGWALKVDLMSRSARSRSKEIVTLCVT